MDTLTERLLCAELRVLAQWPTLDIDLIRGEHSKNKHHQQATWWSRKKAHDHTYTHGQCED